MREEKTEIRRDASKHSVFSSELQAAPQATVRTWYIIPLWEAVILRKSLEGETLAVKLA